MIHNIPVENQDIIGVFLEGKQLRAGRIKNNQNQKSLVVEIDNMETEEVVIDQLIKAIEKVFSPNVVGIGIGVPSVVDVHKGIVYNAEHIPSWKEVYLGDILARQFGVKIYVNNDANCFTVGEKYFGKGKKFNNMVGIVAGVGIGMGIIIDNKLYSGQNCGAGEFGSIPYRDHNYEYYCTLGYFELKYGLKADKLYQRARKEDKIALAILEQFGLDFGQAIKTILFTLDPEFIVIGGPIARFYPFFKPYITKSLRTFPYPKTIERLQIDVSDNPDIPVLGAAALYFDAMKL
ncbi:MAG TPA: ROK family protein [Bacteroidales bacterium]|nr:ROK family protein [Bacteroidales bacterium]